MYVYQYAINHDLVVYEPLPKRTIYWYGNHHLS